MSRAKEIIKLVEYETDFPDYMKLKHFRFQLDNGSIISIEATSEEEARDRFTRQGGLKARIAKSLGIAPYHDFSKKESLTPEEKKRLKRLDQVMKRHGSKFKVPAEIKKEYQALKSKSEAMEREFEVSLRGGDQNATKTKKVYKTSSAADAARSFMREFFPNEDIFLPLRPEQPEKSGDGVVTVWSVGTTASGLRVWIRGL